MDKTKALYNFLLLSYPILVGGFTTNQIPVQMICCMDTDGTITPLRFRFENREKERITVENIRVLARKELYPMLSFWCATNLSGVEWTYLLFFNTKTRTWYLRK